MVAWGSVPAVDDESLDCGEDELPPLPQDLEARLDELFAQFGDRRPLEDAAVRELLWGVLERVGGLDEYRLNETTDGWAVEDARDEQHRRQLICEQRGFVVDCARGLDAIAGSAVEFTLALWTQCDPEEQPAKLVDEARAEIASELQISVDGQGERPPLEASKRDVEVSLRFTLRELAAEVAAAAHELSSSRLPGAAGSTMLHAAEAATFAAYEIRRALADQDAGGA